MLLLLCVNEQSHRGQGCLVHCPEHSGHYNSLISGMETLSGPCFFFFLSSSSQGIKDANLGKMCMFVLFFPNHLKLLIEMELVKVMLDESWNWSS